MSKINTEKQKKKLMQQSIDNISGKKSAPFFMFVVLIVLYIIASIIVSSTAGSTEFIEIKGTKLPFTAIAGVFSSLSNICIILIALYFGKRGYYISLMALLFQLCAVTFGIILNHNLGSIPGIVNSLISIITIVIIYFNNREIEKYQGELRDQAVTDRLTGLPNRFGCNAIVEELTKQGDSFVIVSVDINGFKSINNSMGYEAGNKVLIEIASRWNKIADTGISGTLDFITRTSGDEFVFIIRNYHSQDDVLSTIKQYESALGSRLTVDNCDFYITACFGYAEFPVDSKVSDTVFSYADTALHEIKRAKSSEHILRFTPDLLKMERTLEIESKIRNALENDTLYYNLQPQYDMEHKLRGFEVLARMKDEEGNFISPGEFIPVAEKVGLIDKVDTAVFKKAAEFFGDLLKRSDADLILSVNASVRHLMKNDFLDEIKDLLKSSGIPPQRLEIEITESIMIDSADKALKCINELKSMGVKLAIDDFGTGYSSLSYLNSFPADILKIDKSFIDKMNTGESSRQYVAAIISIGHIMGFSVISEGVEEDDQLATLREIGCDYIQGYIWGRPLPVEEAEKLVIGSAA